MHQYLSFFASLVVLLVVYKTVNLARYIFQARATGLPYVITPVLETEILGLLLTPLLRHIYDRYLEQGKGWPRWCRFIIKDWQWEDKYRAHEEYGDIFLCVSPEGIICYSADASMGWDVMNRRNDFTKPPDKYKLLELYGPNVATAEGKTYRFHVRMTAPPFGDLSGVNDMVWDETVHQTRRLSEAWSKESRRELHMDVNSLTLAVISLAGFGKRLDWVNSTEKEDVTPGFQLSFLKAINDTTANMVPILLFPSWFMNLCPPLRPVKLAHQQLESYIRGIIRSERAHLEEEPKQHQNNTSRANLLTSVIRASRTEAQLDQKTTGQDRKDLFTENEVMGNLFIYLLAGYETTANAIIYGLILLALHQDVQTKVMAEISTVVAAATAEGRPELSYKDDFEKLVYTYAFMYESFRLYPGVTLITKMTNNGDTIYASHPTDSSRPPTPHVLPAGARVYLSAPGVHFNPHYWPNPEVLDPTRWLAAAGSSPDNDLAAATPAPIGAKTISYQSTAAASSAPPGPGAPEKKVVGADRTRQMRGTLLTFSDGARSCLGRKFAQAEFMACIVTLLQAYRVVLAPGEDPVKVHADIWMKSAGKVTLSPGRGIGLRLVARADEKLKD